MGKTERPEVEKYCALCEHSIPTYDNNRVLCEKKGIVFGGYSCRKFIYDPQKRTPAKAILPQTE